MPQPDEAPLLIFDLDGTVLRVNSFPRWALCMATARVRGPRLGARLRLALQAQTLLARRKLGRTHHEALLADLSAAWRAACGPVAEQAGAAFAAGLLRHVRPELAGVLDRVARGDADAVLATAASEDYARALGRALGFFHVLASD
ncbi:MAG: haloacid dehalogenase-like hydrolase, partial [Acetobacteraceae bacterium]